jgi:putative spermidine/putrescine transport system permease protein
MASRAVAAPPARPAIPIGVRFAAALGWLPVLVFLGIVGAFLIAPTIMLLVQAFSGADGPTLDYVAQLGDYRYAIAFRNSLVVSAASAAVGLVAGGLVAHAVTRPAAPGWLRTGATSFAAVASNFAGVPLAFAFISTLGALGLLTIALKRVGIDIYGMGFSLYSLTGLTVTYAYFQIPLMLVIILPALDGLRREWREAAFILGASPWQFWRHVGLPVLAPSLLAAFVLLFGNAFSAYATPFALTSGNIGLVPIEISNVLSGNVMLEPQVGAALAAGMVAVMAVVLALYGLAGRRAARWKR